MTFDFTLPLKKKSYYQYWIKTKTGLVGPYGTRSDAKSVSHKGHTVVKRKRK